MLGLTLNTNFSFDMLTTTLLQQTSWNALTSYLFSAIPVYHELNGFKLNEPFVWVNFVTQSLCLTFIFFGLLFFMLTTGMRFVKTFAQQTDIQFTSYSYFADLEEEMGSADDALIFFLVFGLIIVWFFGFTLCAGYINGSLGWIISLFLFVALTAICVPSFVLKNFGLAFVVYVRGGGRSTSLLFESMLDFVAVAVIMIRFLIQNIRFVFIFSAFFELYEYSYDKLISNFSYLFQTSLYAPQLAMGETSWYFLQFAGHLVLQWALYLYYIGHLTLLFIAQLSIYFALSFWLFFFLYTTFTLETQEKYFAVVR